MDDRSRPSGTGQVASTRAAAEVLRADLPRTRAARRLRLRDADVVLDRIAELAARLLGAPIAQISLLDDVEVVVAGTGLPPGTVGREGPLDTTACAVPAAEGVPVAVPDVHDEPRAADLPQVRAGVVGAYLGAPMVDSEGFTVGVLCVAAPAPRPWSDADVTTLRQLAAAAVSELELAALRTQYEGDRLRWGLAVDAAGIGAFDWDLHTGELAWDERLIEMFGYASGDFGGTIDDFEARVHPDDLPRVTDALQASIASCGDFAAEYRVVWPSGETRWLQARGRTLADERGAATRVLGAAHDTSAERAAAMRVTRVLDAMPAGFYSLDRDWRFTHVNAEAERLLGADREELLGRELWTVVPAVVGGVFEESYRTAVRTGTPVQFDAYHPAPVDGWYEVRAWPSPEGLSVYFLEVTERRRVQDRAERAAQRLALLAQVGAELAGALDAHTATSHLPRLVVPALADWCIVTVVDPDGRPRDVGHWHAVPAARALVERYAAVRLDSMPVTAPLMRALLTGEPVMERAEAVRRLLAGGEARDLLTALDPESAISIPLRGRDRTLGVMTLYFRRGWTPREEDLATAQDVADRAGLALDNARLYGQQRALAEGLQRSLLTEPPEPDHAEIAVRYLPAAEAARVGGDWYDAFLQPGGATMLVIGDVVGHDTEAAAAMGQLRALLRGIATYSDAGPGEVLRGLDASMALLQTRVLATATVARFEQTDDERARGLTRMRWANAGHLPPLVIDPHGGVTELTTWRGDLLLGVDPDCRREESVVTLERGATVLMFTDGLVERRDADLDAGLTRLCGTLRELAGRPLQDLLDRVLDRLVDGRPEDDVALVAVRLHRQDAPHPPEAGPDRVPDVVPEDPAG